MLGLLGATLLSCSKQGVHGEPAPDLPPTVELSQVPAAAETSGTYVYEVSWAGYDADGRVERFQYAVDPPSRADAETIWVSTTANRATFVFHADSVGSGQSTRARGFHTVAVIAWDDRGARSPVVSASFTATTIAPSVNIVSPVPSSLLDRQVAPSLRVRWQGFDPDGVRSQSPVAYRWKLLTESGDFPRSTALLDPDALRRAYAPAFAGWDSVPGTVTSAELHGLIPGQRYTFVVVAIDEAGAYSPVFTTFSNMLNFLVSSAATVGPILSIRGPVFAFTYSAGGFFTDPVSYIRCELPSDAPIPFQWSARPSADGFIRGYRWAVDLRALDDETPRTDEENDRSHWSRWTTETSVTLPAAAPEGGQATATHLFYLEAEDDLGLRSLGVVQYTLVRATFERDLLIINDTWLSPDHTGVPGCVAGPAAIWPTMAELDTLLYAVGGKPYKCYPGGTQSPTGLFAGYDFDTLTTHLSSPASLTVQRLDRYRHVIWYTDLNSTLQYDSDPFVQARPMPLLRWWSTPGVQNPLLTWILQGGQLWLMGGASAFASLKPYDAPRSANNVFSSALGELGPGRLMYDSAHWRSEVTIQYSARATRSARAVADSPGAPDYSLLPEQLNERTTATDPLPPLRANLVWPSVYPAEYLSRANAIVDPDALDPAVGIAALDTLYETSGGLAGSGFPVMTLYHGRENAPFVFSGFPLWYFQRDQAIQLTDFVLQRIWGMPRRPVPR